MARRRPGRRRAARRLPPRDARGRFTSTGTVASDEDDAKRKKRRRAAVAGSAVAGAAIAGSQAHPASRTRTAAQRRRIVRRHVQRARADHDHLSGLRARAFPTTAVTGKRFDAKTAKREGRRLTKSYRKQVKKGRKVRRKR